MIERRMSHPAADIIPKKFHGPRNGSYRDRIQKDRFMQLKSPRAICGLKRVHLFNLIAGSFEDVWPGMARGAA
jgi:hypothetical protein